VDGQGLKWEQLGFVVVELDGDGGKAVYHGEGEAPYEIESFGG
jgi:hypothetical protein